MGSECPPVQLTPALLAKSARVICRADRGLERLVLRNGVPPLWDRPPGFATLGRIVLEQQVSLEAAATLFRRLDAQIPGGFAPIAIAELGMDALRQQGLTRQKAAYLHGLAVGVADGTIDLEALTTLPDQEAMTRLTALHGIGPWTAGVYLLFALRRPDVWPPGDLALHIAMQSMEQWPTRPASDAASRHAERWAPWRSVAARILWHNYLLERGRAV